MIKKIFARILERLVDPALWIFTIYRKARRRMKRFIRFLKKCFTRKKRRYYYNGVCSNDSHADEMREAFGEYED